MRANVDKIKKSLINLWFEHIHLSAMMSSSGKDGSYMDSSTQQYWTQTLDLIRSSGYFKEDTMGWIAKSELFKIEGDKAYIACRNVIASNLIKNSQELFEDTLSEIWGSALSIVLITRKEMEKMMPEQALISRTNDLLHHGFDTAYTFDSLVEGPSNKEAIAACAAVAKPGSFLALNPLLIYGTSGLGKTHLLNAVGNYLSSNRPECKVNYIYAGDLVSLLVEAMRAKTNSQAGVDAIKAQLLDCDYFLIDDIQNLRSNGCQEVFFTVFNELIRTKKQIIMTSDTHPSEIPTLTKRLISRFSSGLIVNISKPGAETAKRILKKKIEGHEDTLPIDDDVLGFLAVSYSDDVRALEGVLNRLIFNATLFNPPAITMEFAMGVLKDEPVLNNASELNAKSIKKAVIRYYGLSYQDLEGKSRQKKIVQARQICIYLMRDMLSMPYAAIGAEVGGRDHTTISTSCSKVRKMIKTDQVWADAVETLKQKITG